MNATTYAAQYLATVDATAPIAVTTWYNKTLTRREQRDLPVWKITAALKALVEDGKAREVESVMGAAAYIPA